MIAIDGSQGEGGGQILRSALALSICTGRPFRIARIRGGRARPGLLRQHLTAVRAATAIAGARVDGAELGSQELSFVPRETTAGAHRFSVGSAGSAMLVLQTILPPLLTASGPSELVIEGGTHNPLAPPFEFIAQAFLPLVRRLGPGIDAVLERPGFHPAGGGRVRVSISPVVRLAPFDLCDRGALVGLHAEAISAGIAVDVGRRELAALALELGWPAEALARRDLDPSFGPGNVLLAILRHEHVCEVFAEFGSPGVASEQLAIRLARRVRGFGASRAAVGPHLADQILLPMALAGGGRFTTVAPSAHLRSNAEVIEAFLPLQVDVVPLPDGSHGVEIRTVPPRGDRLRSPRHE